MIQFEIQKKQRKYKNYLKLSDIQRIECDMPFSILIDYQRFFFEPDFPVLDFLYSVNEWKSSQNNQDFFYVCIETEDNPLISFIRENDMWMICSPWQLFDCKNQFTKDELVDALNGLEKMIYQ